MDDQKRRGEADPEPQATDSVPHATASGLQRDSLTASVQAQRGGDRNERHGLRQTRQPINRTGDARTKWTSCEGAAETLLIPARRNSNLQEPHKFLRDEPVRGDPAYLAIIRSAPGDKKRPPRPLLGGRAFIGRPVVAAPETDGRAERMQLSVAATLERGQATLRRMLGEEHAPRSMQPKPTSRTRRASMLGQRPSMSNGYREPLSRRRRSKAPAGRPRSRATLPGFCSLPPPDRDLEVFKLTILDSPNANQSI
ncbi:hypothetical protein MAPG_10416 [Magnaporthiopsis poae ATCC 64411]|uniref:Uncharacterized protein n=1 Tax=Magnaporthiopsis poae (strain ATCC 64411 / 73-15) TaxID=644358 RepID=A0A0C4ECI9_MAGP6|nr:hypothetical protein MAPG_10416 [Magnaporthiopsis poae ATCC 64411]